MPKLLVLGLFPLLLFLTSCQDHFSFSLNEKEKSNQYAQWKVRHTSCQVCFMQNERANVNAIKLRDGKIFIYGGYEYNVGNKVSNKVDLYDPQTKRFKVLSPSHVPRLHASLTELDDGRILLVGGYSSSPSTTHASVEIYDFETNQWSIVASMPGRRTFHSALKLSDGRVLVTGGAVEEDLFGPESEATQQPIIYDPVLDQWQTFGLPNVVHRFGAKLLQHSNGTIYLIGGRTVFTAIADYKLLEYFDEATQGWIAIDFALTHDVSYHVVHEQGQYAFELPDGRIILSSGIPIIFDPDTETLSLTGGMTSADVPSAPRNLYGASVLTSSGKLIRAGGSWDNATLTDTTEVYDPTTDTWQSLSPMLQTTYYMEMIALEDDVVINIGGLKSYTSLYGNYLGGIDYFDLNANSWERFSYHNLSMEGQAILTLPNDHLLVTGGFVGTRSLTENFIVDPMVDKWTPIASFSASRSHHTMEWMNSDEVLIIGGSSVVSSTRTVHSDNLIYSLSTNTFSAASPLNIPRTNHRSLKLRSGKILVMGGLDSSLQSLNNGEIYDPLTDTWTFTSGGSFYRGSDFYMYELSDGRVIVFGELTDDLTQHYPPEIYDPVTDTWTTMNGESYPRIASGLYSSFVPLGNDEFILTGGIHVDMVTAEMVMVRKIEIFNAQTNQWRTLDTELEGRALHVATLLSDGRVLLSGGITDIMATDYISESMILNPENGETVTLGGVVEAVNQKAVTLSNGNVVVLGGRSLTENKALRNMLIYYR